jgi:flagellar motor switch protein FliG
MAASAAAAAAPAPAAGTVPGPRKLHGPDRAAALLLAMGKPAASRLLRRFDTAELKEIARAVSGLGTIAPGDLESLIEEFSGEFAAGMSLMGTADEVEKLLTGILPGEQITDIMADVMGQKPATTSGVWERVSQISETSLAEFLGGEHPQTAALILSRVRPETAASVLTATPPDLRNALMRRMTALKPVTPAALRVLESGMHDALLTTLEKSGASDAYLRMADILNRMEPGQTDEILSAIEEGRPDVAKSLRRLLFRFEDLAKLTPKARAIVFDQIPAEQVVQALRQVDGELLEMVLSSIASRTRRMVEHELQSAGEPDPKAIKAARRLVADRAMELISKGEISLNASENEPG